MNRETFERWIAANVEGTGYGKCVEKAVEMAEAFPEELEVRQGLFHDPDWGPRQHRWCRVRGTSQIVDPTARQFPSGVLFPNGAGSLFYEDLTDTDSAELRERVPSGKCLECGELLYGESQFCDSSCASAYTSFVMDSLNHPYGF